MTEFVFNVQAVTNGCLRSNEVEVMNPKNTDMMSGSTKTMEDDGEGSRS